MSQQVFIVKLFQILFMFENIHNIYFNLALAPHPNILFIYDEEEPWL